MDAIIAIESSTKCKNQLNKSIVVILSFFRSNLFFLYPHNLHRIRILLVATKYFVISFVNMQINDAKLKCYIEKKSQMKQTSIILCIFIHSYTKDILNLCWISFNLNWIDNFLSVFENRRKCRHSSYSFSMLKWKIL